MSCSWAAAINSAGTGNWSNPATWSPSQVPTAVDTVNVLAGHTVTLDSLTATASTTTVNGTLAFSRVASSSLTLVGGSMTVNAAGTLDMGTEASPIPAAVKADLVLAYGPPVAAAAYGLTIANGGNFTVRAATKTRVATVVATDNLLTTENTLLLSQTPYAIGWSTGDVITVSPTQGSGVGSLEERVITGIAGDVVTVDSNWSNIHYGTWTVFVANLTSNVLVRSSGTSVSGGGANSAYIRNLTQSATSFSLLYGELAYLGRNNDGFYGVTFDAANVRGTISSSTIRNGYRSVHLNGSSSNMFNNNNFYAASDSCFRNSASGKNQLIANQVMGCEYNGLYVISSNDYDILNNTAYSNGSVGIHVSGGIHNHANYNRTFSNASAGITFSGTNGRVTSNTVYGNYYGIMSDIAVYATILGNTSTRNGNELHLNVGSRNNLIVGNDLSGSTNRGIAFFSASSNTLISNAIYSNKNMGIDINTNSTNNLFDGNLIGYSSSGAAAQNFTTEFRLASTLVGNVVMRNNRINPSLGISTVGLNVPQNYLLSYNQDYDTGTLRIWGNYIVAGSTLTLDYASRLYASTNTAANLMRGLGHAITNIATFDNATLSELITVTALDSSNWKIEGSSSGIINASYSCPSGPCSFTSSKVNFTLTPGGTIIAGDILDFATLAASNDAGQQKQLKFGPSAPAFNGGRSKLEVDPTGGLVLTGTSANPTLVDMIPGGTYYSLVSSGAFTMAYATMSNTDSGGLQLSGGAGVAVSSSVFDLIGKNAGTASYITARDLTSNATFYNVAFNLSRSTSGLTNAYNILAQGSDANLNWTVIGSPAGLWGESYNFDPNSKIAWTDVTCLPRTSAGSGNWSNPAIWSGGVPSACSPTTVLAGHTVTLDSLTATASTTTVNGTLAFSRVASSSLTLVGGDITVNAAGTLDMGTESAVIPTGVNAHLILSSGPSAGYYGLTINPGGNFTVRGATKTPYGFATASITGARTSLTIPASSAANWAIGDSITIGPTSGSGAAATEERVVTNITGTDPLTVSFSALTSDRVLTATSPIIVSNLTRNVLVRSSGTIVNGAGGNSAYIRNLAQNTTSFDLRYGEFAYLGANIASKYGITFDGSLTRGFISSSTIRNGYRGIYLNVSSNNTLTANNSYSNSSYGIFLNVSSNNTLTANNSYSNSSHGISFANSSSNNTLTANNSYSNANDGISLSVASNNTLTANNFYSNSTIGISLGGPNNTLTANNSYSNASSGISLGGPNNTLTANNSYSNASSGISLGGSNNTLTANNSYSNSSSGFILNSSSNNTFVGGNLGYDSAGVIRPNSGEFSFDSGVGVESLILKGTRVNPTAGVSVAGMNVPGAYLLSYNQDYSTGTVRLWGDYQLAGSTLTLDYASQLYASTNTAPKLMRGTGHSITAVLTKDAATLSELLTVTAVGGGNWRVEGSSSGVLNAAFNCPAGACAFTHAKVDFTLNVGGTLNAGDSVDFVTTAASGDANRQKQLLFGPSASAFNGGRSKLAVDPTGGLVLTGTAANPTLVDMIPGGTYYSLVSSGAFTMAYATMSNTDSSGLQLSGSNGVSISSSVFDLIGKNAGTASYITARDLTSNATFYNVAFNLSRSTSGLTAYNARTAGADAGLWWNFSDATGPFSGATYEYDPGGRVRWTEPVPPGAIGDLFASTGTFSGTIALAWSAPGNNGATGTLNAGSEFRVQYTTDSAFSAWSPTAAQPAHVFRASISTSGVAPGSARGYQLGGLAPGATHYLRMFTADESGNWSSVSNAAVSSATVDSVAPGAVTNLSAAPGGAEGGITLTWTSPGNDGYVQAIGAGQFLIALSTNAADLTSAATSQAQIVIATAAAPGTLQSYTTGSLLLATSYYFRIWTRDEVPLYSSLSNGATAQARQFTPLPPSSFATSQIVGQITLTWAAPSTPPAPYLDHYEISYSTVAQTGPYTALASISSEVFTFAHTSLLNRTTYYYRALTADTGGLKSAPSENFAVTPDTVPPSGVTDLSAALGAELNEIELQWTASGDDGMTGTLAGGSRYAIQYTTDAVGVVWNTANAQVVLSTSGVSPGAVQRRTLTGLTQSSTYYVRLWTGDPALNWSVASNISTSTSRQPGPVILSLLPAAGASGVSRTATVTVTFDKTVSYAALNGTFSLTLVRDASGNTVSVPAAGALSPASNASAFTFTPAAALAGNGVYMVSITTNALDVQGNPLQAAASAQFTTIMDRNAANSIVVAALGLTITVPAGALAADGYIQASTTAVSAAVTEANRKLISNSGDSSRAPVTGTVVDLTVYDALGAVQPGAFGAPVTVAMTYPDADGDGLVDGAAVPVRADTLGVWWLDEAASLWVRLPSSSADLQAKRVSAATSHFTTFALIGQAATGLADAYPYPVPFRPSKGHTKITFTGLGQTTRIRIFTVAGDKVADLTSNSIDGKYDWGVVNSAGQPVASGVYLYLLESGSNSKKGKLVVIR